VHIGQLDGKTEVPEWCGLPADKAAQGQPMSSIQFFPGIGRWLERILIDGFVAQAKAGHGFAVFNGIQQ
jgi:hypothetical protein